MTTPEKQDNEYLSNAGQKWTHEEEMLLLAELDKNISIAIIAETHSRTIGGINSRRREIAYKMFLTNVSIEKIMQKTKLDEETIHTTIDKRENYKLKKIAETKKCFSVESYIPEIKNDITEMKNDITEMKRMIKEFAEMMKAVYDFEDA